MVCGAGAFAVGGVTGRRQAATGIGAMLVGLGWLFAGLLPQWSQTKDVARFIPWYWYSEPSVLLNGLDAGYMALMIAVAVVLFVVGIVGLNVRDLRGNLRGTFLAQRIQHVGWVWQAVKGTSSTGRDLYSLLVLRHAGLLVVLGVVMFAVMGLLMGPIYQQMAPQLETASQSMPPALLQAWGATDMASPAGFYWGETMSLIGAHCGDCGRCCRGITVGCRSTFGSAWPGVIHPHEANPCARLGSGSPGDTDHHRGGAHWAWSVGWRTAGWHESDRGAYRGCHCASVGAGPVHGCGVHAGCGGFRYPVRRYVGCGRSGSGGLCAEYHFAYELGLCHVGAYFSLLLVWGRTTPGEWG